MQPVTAKDLTAGRADLVDYLTSRGIVAHWSALKDQIVVVTAAGAVRIPATWQAVEQFAAAFRYVAD